MPETDPYGAFVRERLAAGNDPNTITDQVTSAIYCLATDWVLWGDGRWRLDTVCSVCGSDLPGICGHKGDPERRVVLRRVYEEAR